MTGIELLPGVLDLNKLAGFFFVDRQTGDRLRAPLAVILLLQRLYYVRIKLLAIRQQLHFDLIGTLPGRVVIVYPDLCDGHTGGFGRVRDHKGIGYVFAFIVLFQLVCRGVSFGHVLAPGVSNACANGQIATGGLPFVAFVERHARGVGIRIGRRILTVNHPHEFDRNLLRSDAERVVIVVPDLFHLDQNGRFDLRFHRFVAHQVFKQGNEARVHIQRGMVIALQHEQVGAKLQIGKIIFRRASCNRGRADGLARRVGAPCFQLFLDKSRLVLLGDGIDAKLIIEFDIAVVIRANLIQRQRLSDGRAHIARGELDGDLSVAAVAAFRARVHSRQGTCQHRKTQHEGQDTLQRSPPQNNFSDIQRRLSHSVHLLNSCSILPFPASLHRRPIGENTSESAGKDTPPP